MLLDLVKQSQTFPLALLVFYFFAMFLTLANYVWYFRYEEARYGTDFKNAYLAFVIIGYLVYAFIAGMCWLWAVRYVQDPLDRLNKTGYGLWAIFLFHDLPCFILDFHAYLCCGGLYTGLQGVNFVVQWISFLVSFVFAWQSYTWVMASFLNSNYGDGFQDGLKTGQQQLNVLPPVVPKMVGGGAASSRAGSEYDAPLLPADSVPIRRQDSPRGYEQGPLRRTEDDYPRNVDYGGDRPPSYNDGYSRPGSRRNDYPHRAGLLSSGPGLPMEGTKWSPSRSRSGSMAGGNIPIEDPAYRGPSLESEYPRVIPRSVSSRDSGYEQMPPPARRGGTIYVERDTF